MVFDYWCSSELAGRFGTACESLHQTAVECPASGRWSEDSEGTDPVAEDFL